MTELLDSNFDDHLDPEEDIFAQFEVLGVRRGFDNIVDQQKSYLRTDRDHVTLALRSAVKNLFAMEEVGPDESLLEIGCGIGYFRSLVPPQFRDNFLHTDPSLEALGEAKKLYPDAKFKMIDAMRMQGIPSRSVNRVFALNLLNYVSPSRRKRILDEVDRVLKPGGTFFALSDLQPNPRSILPTLAKEANIPLQHAGISTMHFNGSCYVKAVDEREGSGFAQAFGGSPTNSKKSYVPMGPYLSEKVLHPLFQRHFSKSEFVGIVGRSPLPLLTPACLVRMNTYARLYDVLGSSKFLNTYSRIIDSESEVQGERFPHLRRLEIAIIQMNKGVK